MDTKQLIHLIGQHRFYAAACMVGTAVTLAFVMVVVMVYDFRTANVAPETERSRMLYNTGTQCMRANGTNLMGYRGLGPTAFEALYNNLPGVDTLTWHGGLQRALCSLPASSDRQSVFLRPVGPFTQAEYDAGRAAFQKAEDEWRNYRSLEDGVTRRFVVITERLARQLFGSADRAVGGEMQMDFQTVRVVGVVRDVSSIFQTAYADVWEPFTLLNETQNYTVRETGGLAGLRYAVMRRASGTSPSDIRAEVEHRLERLNRSGGEYVLSDPQLYTHTEYTFFRGSSIDARLVYALLLIILLVVPAVGISGLVHAQMQSRLSEIAIRKAYGATNADIIGRLFLESLGTTLIGGLLGYGLSCLLVVAGSAWLFGAGGVQASGIVLGADLLLRPVLFVVVLLVCLVFNALSTLLPAWIAVRRNIAFTLVGGE